VSVDDCTGLDEVLIIKKSKLQLEKEAAAAAAGNPGVPQSPQVHLLVTDRVGGLE